jgi:hypothetical protein
LEKRKKKEKKSSLELGRVVAAATKYECVARKKKGLRLSFQAFKGHFTIWKAQNLLIGR